jgi:hypothetical protein
VSFLATVDTELLLLLLLHEVCFGSAGEDFRFAGTKGERPLRSWIEKAVGEYVDDLISLSASDGQAWKSVVSVRYQTAPWNAHSIYFLQACHGCVVSVACQDLSWFVGELVLFGRHALERFVHVFALL